MLSAIFRLAEDFERSHAVRPNLLYLHPRHLRALRTHFAGPDAAAEIVAWLRMDLVVDSAVIHPHVAWSPLIEREAG